ncbi:PAS domain S-box protein [Moorena sp. SIO3H5]|uniref:PAS domain S-box protein n=1 Tax=Moorena sp. SIO3H5 TaxID=2607834 RepID=UPI0013BB6CB1|nr:PAS domain S-box protein [Moorena sp. SIO3H5]NEO70387.1 PAS domain S-box protein [Moorena sp. SIO3H5]
MQDSPSVPNLSQDIRLGCLQWFYNLPLSSKLLTGLFASELISLIGFFGVAASMMLTEGQIELRDQAQSELALTETKYNSQIEQTKLGFRGQADNSAIIAAAIAHHSGQPIKPALKAEVRRVLRNEIKARNIEYGTLVGTNGKIIANANADRTGESFNPNQLVSQVFQDQTAIGTSQIVSWVELAKESPQLPNGFVEQDALIRYTLTPVKNPETGNIVAVLVSGDLVNGKLPIVHNTLQGVDKGYSAIYYRQSSGEFNLATATLNNSDVKDLEQGESSLDLVDGSLLEKAVAQTSEVVYTRQTLGKQSYTIVAKALTNFDSEATIVLVRGTTESSFNQFLRDNLEIELSVLAIALIADIFLAILLGRSIAKPVKQLQTTTQEFAAGNLEARVEVWTKDEVGKLGINFNRMADTLLAAFKQRERYAAEQSRLNTQLQQEIAERLLTVETLKLIEFSLDRVGDAVFLSKQDGRFCYVNEAACHFLGYSREELLRLHVYDIDPLLSKDNWLRFWKNLKQQGYFKQDSVYRTKEGREFPVEMGVNYLHFNDQEYNCVIARDITERKQGENLLKRTNFLLKAQQEASIDGILVIDENQKILWHNRRFGQMWNIPEEILNSGDDQKLLKSVVSKLNKPKEFIHRLKYLCEHPREVSRDEIYLNDGRIFDRYCGSVVSEASDYYTRIWYFRDITQTKQVEAQVTQLNQELSNHALELEVANTELAATKDFITNIINAVSDPIFVKDNHYKWKFFNDSFCEFIGYSREQLLGHDDYEFFVSEEAEVFRKTDQLVMKNGVVNENEEYFTDAKGIIHFISTKKTRFFDSQNHPYIVGVIRDLTHRKQLEDRLAKLNECFLDFGSNPDKNINHLVAVCGQLLNASFALYNCLEYNQLVTLGKWQVPPDYPTMDSAKGRICYDVIRQGTDESVVKQDLQNTAYAQTDPNITAYNLCTYIGIAVKWNKKVMGSLCVLYQQQVEPSTEDKQLLNLIASAIGVEEQRKQAQQELQDSKERFALAVEGVNDGIWDCNLQTGEMYLSPRWKSMLGYNDDEITNTFESWTQIIHPDDLEQTLLSFNNYLEGKLFQYQEEFRALHKDGTYRWLLTRGAALWDKTGKPYRIAGSHTDISERKKAEEALNSQLTALEAATDGIALVNPAGEYFYLNQTHLELFGYTQPNELVGRQWHIIYPPEEIERIEKSVFPQLFKTGKWSGEATAVRKDGSTFAEEFSLTLLEDGGLIRVCRDITQRKQAEEQMRQNHQRLAMANAQLERATRLKDEFLASMSHELRTPLNAILGLSEALQEEVYGSITDRQRKSLGTIQGSGQHLLELINDLLDLAKIESGKMELHIGAVSLQKLCNSSLMFVRNQAHHKNIKLTSQVTERLWEIEVDERRIRQVLINLLSNAVKFTPTGGSVILKAEENLLRNTICFSVIDTGIGIAQENMRKLFQSFVQIDSRLSRRYAGTGLGLALVQRTIEIHGGRVDVESEVGKGSCFTVTLPIKQNGEANGEYQSDLSDLSQFTQSAISNPQVLIIEDSITAAEVISRYIREIGLQTLTYPEGEGALEQVIQVNPGVIILDLQLPKVSGWKVLAQLKAHPQTQHIPVIILSVVDERSQALEMGASEYLVKPVSRKLLRSTISKILGPLETPESVNHAETGLVVMSQTAPESPLILIAEDNETNIKTIWDYLLNKGYRLILAKNGWEAISQAKEYHPQLIMMDIQMPDMDGIEAIKRIRDNQETSTIPIIAVTALAMPGDKEKCLGAGADEYISKPVSLKNLVSTIQQYVHVEVKDLQLVSN